MRITLLAIFASWLLAGASAQATDPLAKLPAPVLNYAKQFKNECKGLGELIVNENYAGDGRGQTDLNADGQQDYFVYKCMFGCSKSPYAFMGKSNACPWGSLLLSNGGSYDQVFLPGRVGRLNVGSSIQITIKRPKALRLVGNFCKDPFPGYEPEYVYELKDKRFQLNGMCSPSDHTDCLAGSVSVSGF